METTMGMMRGSAVAALFLLASCAGFTPAGRSSGESAPPPPPVAAPPVVGPAPAPAAPTPSATAAPAAGPSVAAPGVVGPTPPPRAQPNENADVVVPGIRERQVPAPHGDPRTEAERMADIQAWDRCVTRIQNMGESNPTRPVLEQPEDYCRRTLGMENRTAVPQSRQR